MIKKKKKSLICIKPIHNTALIIGLCIRFINAKYLTPMSVIPCILGKCRAINIDISKMGINIEHALFEKINVRLVGTCFDKLLLTINSKKIDCE